MQSSESQLPDECILVAKSIIYQLIFVVVEQANKTIGYCNIFIYYAYIATYCF